MTAANQSSLSQQPKVTNSEDCMKRCEDYYITCKGFEWNRSTKLCYLMWYEGPIVSAYNVVHYVRQGCQSRYPVRCSLKPAQAASAVHIFSCNTNSCPETLLEPLLCIYLYSLIILTYVLLSFVIYQSRVSIIPYIFWYTCFVVFGYVKVPTTTQ